MIMSSINLHSHSKKGKKSPTNYASFGLFVAALAIAVSAAVVRVRKDRASTAEDLIVPDTSASQAVDTAGTTQNAQSAQPTTSATAAQNTQQKPTQPQGADKPASSDDFDALEDSEQTLAIQVMGRNANYIRPAAGAITKDYSMNGLVYSKTMGDWRVHNGLDIAANEGEIVKSAAEGTVTDVSDDPLYGTTVVVNQNDGLMVYYRGLAKDTAVRSGENVAAGATLGTVGSIPCESGDGTHLHIEVKRENQYLNPSEALNIK